MDLALPNSVSVSGCCCSCCATMLAMRARSSSRSRVRDLVTAGLPSVGAGIDELYDQVANLDLRTE